MGYLSISFITAQLSSSLKQREDNLQNKSVHTDVGGMFLLNYTSKRHINQMQIIGYSHRLLPYTLLLNFPLKSMLHFTQTLSLTLKITTKTNL